MADKERYCIVEIEIQAEGDLHAEQRRFVVDGERLLEEIEGVFEQYAGIMTRSEVKVYLA